MEEQHSERQCDHCLGWHGATVLVAFTLTKMIQYLVTLAFYKVSLGLLPLAPTAHSLSEESTTQ